MVMIEIVYSASIIISYCLANITTLIIALYKNWRKDHKTPSPRILKQHKSHKKTRVCQGDQIGLLKEIATQDYIQKGVKPDMTYRYCYTWTFYNETLRGSLDQ